LIEQVIVLMVVAFFRVVLDAMSCLPEGLLKVHQKQVHKLQKLNSTHLPLS